MSSEASPEYLLQGALYSLEQCGRLLHDANLLYRTGSYSTALVLAAFAREEHGRYIMLVGLRREALDGKVITIRELKKRTSDHKEKQRRSIMSIAITGAESPETRRVMEIFGKSETGSEEQVKARAEIDAIMRKKKRRMPNDRHELRTSAMYVEPSEGRWGRPQTAISQEVALKFIIEATNEYGLQYRRQFVSGPTAKVGNIDQELYDAIQAWQERPILPLPECPIP